MTGNEEKINPVAHLVAWIVERDPQVRTRLLATAAASDFGGEWPGWRVFCVRYAAHHPWLTLFFPVAVSLYALVVAQWLGA